MDAEDKQATPEGTSESYKYPYTCVEEYLENAELKANSDQLAEAVEILREAVRRFPDSAEAHYDLGMALFMLLEMKLANVDIWKNLAEDEGLAEECVAAFEAAIEKKPDFAPAYANLGNLMALRGNGKAAVSLWTRALELDPNQPEIRDNLQRYQTTLLKDETT
jgi:tetratricopeptide (TPR) repeat protein